MRTSYQLTDVQRQVVEALQRHEARFLVVGGRALQALGVQRRTVDLDILSCSSEPDALRTWKALVSVDSSLRQTLDPQALGRRQARVTIDSQRRHEVDVLTSIGQLDFEALYRDSIATGLGGISYHVPSIEGLIATKKVSIQVSDADLLMRRMSPSDRERAEQCNRRDRDDIAALQELAQRR